MFYTEPIRLDQTQAIDEMTFPKIPKQQLEDIKNSKFYKETTKYKELFISFGVAMTFPIIQQYLPSDMGTLSTWALTYSMEQTANYLTSGGATAIKNTVLYDSDRVLLACAKNLDAAYEKFELDLKEGKYSDEDALDIIKKERKRMEKLEKEVSDSIREKRLKKQNSKSNSESSNNESVYGDIDYLLEEDSDDDDFDLILNLL